MDTILIILGAIFLIFLFVVLAAVCIISLNLLTFFHLHKCKHCRHTMEYKGLKEDGGNGYYLFYCEHCGVWEQIPREEFFRQCDNSIDDK